jgi:hypothetical protein
MTRAKEDPMPGFTNKTLMALSLCGAFVLGTPAFAQSVEAEAAPAGAPAESASPPAVEQAADAAPAKLGQDTKAQAEHSAEATAHKSVSDPNNQLGTSLQGRTRPVAEADAGSQNTASAAPPQ